MFVPDGADGADGSRVDKVDGADGSRVDKVIRLVGTSVASWEAATRAVVAEASKSIRDLSRARVVDRDIQVRDDGRLVYRAFVEVTFRIDRTRLTIAGHVALVRRILVVGNQTLATAELARVLAERVASGPIEVHVVVPCTPDPLASASAFGDPFTGVVIVDDVTRTEVARTTHAHDVERMAAIVGFLRGLGATTTGEIGPADPVQAVLEVLERASIDEIIVSTAPAGLSKWLRLDLPTRLRRATSLPVTHVATGHRRSSD